MKKYLEGNAKLKCIQVEKLLNLEKSLEILGILFYYNSKILTFFRENFNISHFKLNVYLLSKFF